MKRVEVLPNFLRVVKVDLHSSWTFLVFLMSQCFYLEIHSKVISFEQDMSEL